MLIPVILAAVVSLSSPAGTGSAEPHLAATRDGALLLSWLEGGALKFSSLRGGKWSAPATIVERKDLFVNWADFPSIVESGGTLYAHWLQKSGTGTYSYDIWITSSGDRGKNWRKPRLLHSDGKQAEHGFVSLTPLSGDRVAAVWLDGREMTEGHGHDAAGAMTLRYATVAPNLGLSDEKVLDPRVCECCTTAMTLTSRGPLVAYRDRSEQEIRDISIVRRTGTTWSAPARVHADDWKIAGCPVNGPQLASRDDFVAIAWFTAAANKPQVHAAFSKDAGATFGKPVRIDSSNAVGRVDVILVAADTALVTWIEGTAEKAGIYARRVSASGRLGAPVKVAATSSARASGFPRAAMVGNAVYVAWTDPAAKQLRIAKVE